MEQAVGQAGCLGIVGEKPGQVVHDIADGIFAQQKLHGPDTRAHRNRHRPTHDDQSVIRAAHQAHGNRAQQKDGQRDGHQKRPALPQKQIGRQAAEHSADSAPAKAMPRPDKHAGNSHDGQRDPNRPRDTI